MAAAKMEQLGPELFLQIACISNRLLLPHWKGVRFNIMHNAEFNKHILTYI